ncbi:MAG: MotA/TolQ/ExbB proton channel family protein [Planctomycetota bacterium]
MALVSRFIGLQLAVGLFGWMLLSTSDLMMYVDLPSLIIVIGVSAGVMLACFTPRQLCDAMVVLMNAGAGREVAGRAEAAAVFSRAYQVVWGVGIVGTLFGLISMLADLSDPSAIGAGMAVALIMVAYAALFAELMLAPCKQVVMNPPDRPKPADAPSMSTETTEPGGNTLWKGVTVVSIMITVFFVMTTSFAEINQPEPFERTVEAISDAFSAKEFEHESPKID